MNIFEPDLFKKIFCKLLWNNIKRKSDFLSERSIAIFWMMGP